MKKLSIHVGLAKTGTTFLQEIVFPRTDFCYLGKTSVIHRKSCLDSDPFMFFKYLLNENSGLCFAKMPVAKEQVDQLVALYGYYRNMIRGRQKLLISDESFTGNPLNLLMRFIVKRCLEGVSGIKSQEDCYERGYSLAEHLFCSRNEHSRAFQERLLSSNTISLKIQRCLDALGAELGNVLLVDRDFGSWFPSYFLQFVKAERENLGYLQDVVCPELLFAVAGFVVCCDRFLMDRARPGFVFASSFANCIERDFGSDALDVVQYSSNPSCFYENLQPVFSNYGISPLVLEQVSRFEARRNAACVGPLSFRGEVEILRLRGRFSAKLNDLAGIK